MVQRKPRKKKLKGKTKQSKSNNVQDEKLCLTKGQLCNIVNAAANKKGACPRAKVFIKELKAEMKENRSGK